MNILEKKHIHRAVCIASILWAGVVVRSWYIAHASSLKNTFWGSYGIDQFANILLPSILSLAVILLFWGYLAFTRKTSKITVTSSPLAIFLLFFLYALLIFNITAFSRIPVGSLRPILTPDALISTNVAFISAFLSSTCWIACFSLATYLAGHISIKRFTHHAQPLGLLLILSKFSIGIFLWSIILFVLGYIGQLKFIPILTLFGVLLLTQTQHILRILSAATKKHIGHYSLRSSLFWLGALIVFILTLNTLDALRLAPNGFDESTAYLNRANLIAQHHALIPGGHPFPFELLAGSGYIFSQTAMFAVSNSLIYLLLGMAGIYGLVRALGGSKRARFLAMALWITLPMTSHFVYLDAKPDLLLFLIATLSLWLYIKWFQSQEKNSLLILSAFLAGFAITIKLTAFFFVMPLAVAVLWKIYTGNAPKKLQTLAVTATLCILPILPWFFYAQHTGWHISLSNPLSTLSSRGAHSTAVTPETYRALGVNTDQCLSTGSDEDYGRYTQTENWKHILSLPWVVTMNTRVPIPVNEIGFLFLASLGYIALWITHRAASHKKQTVFLVLLGLSATYGLLWMFLGKGVPWYGFVGFIFPILFIALTATSPLMKKKLFSIPLILLIIAHLIFLTGLRQTQFGKVTLIRALHTDSVAPYLQSNTEIVNTINTSHGIIYATASKLKYHIHKNDERVLGDWYLDTFTCIDQGQDDSRTISRLKDLGITHILFTKTLAHMEADSNGTLHQKVDRFLEFSKKNLSIEHTSNDHILFSVPR